jgi:hypothetical protein
MWSGEAMNRLLEARMRRILKIEAASEPEWLFLSFANKTGFLGAVIMQAAGTVSAVTTCHKLGINPGGEVLVTALTDEEITSIPESATNKLLTRAQVKELGLA